MSAPQPQMIFVNLPVKDLEKSKAFFSALGYSFNPTYTNDDAAGMVISESIYVMLLTQPFFPAVHQQADCRCAHPHGSDQCALGTQSQGS